MNIDQNESAACSGIEEDFSALSLSNVPEGNPNIHSALQKIYSNIQEEEYLGVLQLRKELSLEQNPPIDDVIKTSIVPVLMRMAYQRNEKFAFEVSWILCNIASGNSNHTKYLIDHNCLEFFDKVFDSNPNSLQLRDQIIWAIGNISGDSVHYRDLINRSSLFMKVYNYGLTIIESNFENYIGNLVWTLSNFARGKPPPNQNILKKLDVFFASIFPRIIVKPQVLTDVLWGMTYCSESLKDLSNYSESILGLIIQCLQHKQLTIVVPALRILGNIISSVNNSWRLLKNFNILNILNGFLSHVKLTIRKEAVWIFSNFAAESEEVISLMLDMGIFSSFIRNLEEQDEKVVVEIIWTVSNSFLNASESSAKKLVDLGWIQKFLELFVRKEDPKIKMVILEGISHAANKCSEILNSDLKVKCLEFKEIYQGNAIMQKKIEDVLKHFGEDEIGDLVMENAF